MYRPAPRPLTLVFPPARCRSKMTPRAPQDRGTVPLLLIGAARQCMGASKSPSETQLLPRLVI